MGKCNWCWHDTQRRSRHDCSPNRTQSEYYHAKYVCSSSLNEPVNDSHSLANITELVV
jgi:hypothetical protein